MKKQLSTTILIALILFQFVPIKDFIPIPTSSFNPNTSQTPFIPPDDLEKEFWRTPNIHFSIQYEADKVLMVIQLKNNLSDPLTLFNLWIQVNKSDPFENILLPNTKIIESQNKITLSTFDIDDSHDLEGSGQMIFHIKLYEGEVIDIGEEFNIMLNWHDPDQILAQYNPNLIYNGICDDIQVFFQHSTRTEENQPFPLIERHYYQELSEEGYKIYNVDFKVTNLMASDLNEFNFTYIKIKDYAFEQYFDFLIESPSLTASEISDINTEHSETDKEIEFKLIFGNSVILGSNEWLLIKAIWIGPRESRIENDFIMWNFGDDDSFNNGAPYYFAGLPFYPLLTPAEPIVALDYDFDGLRNIFELAKGFDPIKENAWLAWRALRGEYDLDHSYAQNLKIRGEIMVVTPLSYQGKSLILNLTQLGSDDEIINLKVNGDLFSNKISNIGEFIITSSINRGAYNIEFTLKHGNSPVNSFYKIDFCLDKFEIPDLTSHFEPDSDGDGLYDKFEKEQYKFIPDADLDGVFDGADLMPYRYLPYGSGATFGLNFPIKDTSTNADIAVSIQIKPTLNDHAKVLDYAGNELRIYPGIRIYGINQQGDYLPDTGFSLDNDNTGLAFFNPMKRNGNQETYSWAGTLNYKYNNPAKNDGQILLKFTLVWLIFEYNPISGNSSFFHVYDNNDEYTIQGIAVTENEPTSVVLGIVDDGSTYRKTALYAELAAHLSVSDLSYNPPDIANLELYQDFLYDMENQNNTRDNLRNQFLNTYSLDYETTSFIYITHGYSLTYNLETLYDAFPGENPLRTYTPTERNNFYLLPDTKFLGLLTMKVLKAQNAEYLGQIKYGLKSDTETRVYDLQFSKFKYVGSSSEEILHFKGDLGDDQIEIHLYDLNVHGTGMSTFDSGGSFEYFTQLKIFQFQLVSPQYPGPWNYWETQLIGCVWTWYVDEYEAFAPTVILTIMDIVNTVGGFIKVIDSLTVFKAFSTVFDKITGPLNIIFGTMRFIYGVALYFQGAYASGIAEGIRGGLMVAAGALALFGDPVVCKIIAAAILVVQLVDWLLEEIFGFDLWAEFVSFFWGIKDADPKYSILGNSLVWNEAKIKAQGGFEVGDYIGLNINFDNTGNTQLTFGLELKAGTGSYGSHGSKTISSGDTGSLTATDTFEYASSSFTLTNIVDMSWYYNPPGRWVVNIIPPFVWWVDPPASDGGPYYSDPNRATFNIPVFPNNIPQFINLVESGLWFPTDVPKVKVQTVKDDLTPGVSENIEYRLKIYPYWFYSKTYIIETPTNELWNFEFTYQGITYEDTITIDLPGWILWPYTVYVDVLITPTSENRLRPGDNSIVIRAQDEENPLARTNIILDYNVITIVDFDVIFDPFKPDETELEYDDLIACYINITNTGNVYDTYSIDVNNIDPDIYFLYTPGAFYVGSLATYSAVIGFQIPYYKIIYPGLIEFTVEISSVTDPSVIKVFDCSIDIKQYHMIYFEVEEADLSMTDSDIYDYEFQLTNLGNMYEPIDITYTSVNIADIYLENNYYPLIPGQTEYFNITLIPFELGYREFSVTATSSPWISETIDLSIKIVDDDTQHPYFENFIVKDNENWLNISFIAIDEALGDDLGLSNIDIYVDGVLIHNYQPTPSETVFNFSFTNDWIWMEGIHDIRVDITDADDDTITEDSLTTTTYDTFEVTLDEMYKYVMWLCEEMNNYIYDNGITALYGVVTQKIVKIQGLLWEAYQLIEDGYLHTGLVRNKMAEIKLEIAETKTELMINKQSMSQEHFDHLKDCIRNIRNKIVELMGLSMGTEFSHDISLVEADIYNLRDFVEDSINPIDSENLENVITLAAEKLENAIFDISLDKDTESSLTSAQHALDKAEAEVFALQQKGKISVELANSLMIKILILQWQVELLKGEI